MVDKSSNNVLSYVYISIIEFPFISERPPFIGHSKILLCRLSDIALIGYTLIIVKRIGFLQQTKGGDTEGTETKSGTGSLHGSSRVAGVAVVIVVVVIAGGHNGGGADDGISVGVSNSVGVSVGDGVGVGDADGLSCERGVVGGGDVVAVGQQAVGVVVVGVIVVVIAVVLPDAGLAIRDEDIGPVGSADALEDFRRVVV